MPLGGCAGCAALNLQANMLWGGPAACRSPIKICTRLDHRVVAEVAVLALSRTGTWVSSCRKQPAASKQPCPLHMSQVGGEEGEGGVLHSSTRLGVRSSPYLSDWVVSTQKYGPLPICFHQLCHPSCVTRVCVTRCTHGAAGAGQLPMLICCTTNSSRQRCGMCLCTACVCVCPTPCLHGNARCCPRAGAHLLRGSVHLVCHSGYTGVCLIPCFGRWIHQVHPGAYDTLMCAVVGASLPKWVGGAILSVVGTHPQRWRRYGGPVGIWWVAAQCGCHPASPAACTGGLPGACTAAECVVCGTCVLSNGPWTQGTCCALCAVWLVGW